MIDELISIGDEFRHRREAAERAFGLKNGLAECVDRRDIEEVRVAEGLTDATAIVDEVESIIRSQAVDARGLGGLIRSRIRIELLQDLACALGEFTCGVVCKCNEQDIANARDGSVQYHSSHQMADRIGFSCSSTGFDNGKSAVDV